MTTVASAERIALVTGATRGIGREVARGLAQRGLTVLVGARDREQGEAVATEIAAEGGVARALELDVADDASILAAAASVNAEHARLDVLVNNAGVLHELGFPAPSEVQMDAVRNTYAVNTFGPIAMMHAFVPLLRRGPSGRIVNLSTRHASMSAQAALDGSGLTLLAYNSSKAALNSATLQFARELLDTPMKVNLVDPGHCATDINGHSGIRSAADGARIVIELALVGEDGPTGAFLSAEGAVPW